MLDSRRSWLAGLAVAVILAAISLPAGAADAQFVGVGKCKMCHQTEFKAWSESPHAKAMDALKPEERTKPECVSCHSTGAGKSAAAGADLTNVQCEACHGAGSLYKAADVMNKAKYGADQKAAHAKSVELGLATIDEKTCTACHNSKSTHFKGFDFAAAKAKIKHWK
jgi:cytochrome c5